MSDGATSLSSASHRCPECGAPTSPGGDGVCIACVFGDASEASFDPNRFGRYRLLRRLGEGGMGTVYLAQQDDLDRRVALKQLSAGGWATPDQLNRFKREAEMLSSLAHAKVLTVHEVGKSRGCPYYTMPFMEGGSLADSTWQDRLRHDPRELARLLAEIARTVQHVHDRQIIHRDLKPANILMDGAGIPHVADFGLAKELQGQSVVSATSGIIGTPAYMAPEQIDPEFGGLSTLTDVHALGTVFYELLTGRSPFGARDEDAQTLMRRVRLESPTFSASEIQSIDRDLRVMCLKCLEKRPADRYPSALHLAEDLERWLRHEPIVARHSAATERFVKWVRRRPAIASLTAALVVSVLLGLAVSLAMRSRAESARAAMEERNRVLVLQQAETHFEQGDSAMGLAVLARAMRDQPRFRQAQERLVNELTLTPQYLPGPCTSTNRSPTPFAAPAYGIDDDPQRYARQAVSPDGTWQVEISARNEIVVSPTQDRSQQRVVTFSRPRVIRALAFLNATEYVSGDDEGELCVWHVAESKPRRTNGLQAPIHCLDVARDAATILLGCTDRQIRVCDLSTLRTAAIISLPIDVRAIHSVRFLPGGTELLAAYEVGARGEVGIWSISGQLLWKHAFVVPAWDVQVGAALGELHVLLQTNGWLTLRRCLTAVPKRIGGQAASAVGAFGAPALREEIEALRQDLNRGFAVGPTGMRQRTRIESILGVPVLRFHTQQVLATNLSADGRYLATASRDSTARIWDAHTHQPVGPALLHPAEVNHVRFSLDAQRVVSSTTTRKIRVWDIATAQPLTPWITSLEPVPSVALSRAGNTILTPDGYVIPIHVPQQESPEWLCELAELVGGRRLSADGTANLLDLVELRTSLLPERVRQIKDPQWDRLRELLP
jgi:WD40 repeat protein